MPSHWVTHPDERLSWWVTILMIPSWWVTSLMIPSWWVTTLMSDYPDTIPMSDHLMRDYPDDTIPMCNHPDARPPLYKDYFFSNHSPHPKKTIFVEGACILLFTSYFVVFMSTFSYICSTSPLTFQRRYKTADQGPPLSQDLLSDFSGWSSDRGFTLLALTTTDLTVAMTTAVPTATAPRSLQLDVSEKALHIFLKSFQSSLPFVVVQAHAVLEDGQSGVATYLWWRKWAFSLKLVWVVIVKMQQRWLP